MMDLYICLYVQHFEKNKTKQTNKKKKKKKKKNIPLDN